MTLITRHRQVIGQWIPVLVLLTLLFQAGPLVAGLVPATKDVTLYVTDRGINQKEDWTNKGYQGLHWTMSNFNQEARIAIVMPDDREFHSVSTDDLRQRIFRDLKAQVDRGRQEGVSQFEIQLVQDINLAGYTNLGPDHRQGMVDRFGEAAYGAIADLNVYLLNNGIQTTNHAIVGSNGAKVFAANVEAWQLDGHSMFASLDVFDGRAYLTPMVEAIQKIGAAHVRIFNTAHDYWGPFFPWGLSSIASRSTAHHIKDHYLSDVRVYELSPLGKLPDGNHISGMTDSNSFEILEYRGPAGGLQKVVGRFTGLALRQQLPASVPRTLPHDQQGGITVWRTSAKDFVKVIRALGDYSKKESRLGDSATPLLKGTHGGLRLVNAMMKDLEGAGDLDYVHLSSNTVEELIKWTADQVHQTDFAKRSTSKLLFRELNAYKEFFSGAMDMVRTGTLNTDAVTKIDRGVIEIFKQEWRENNPQLKAARWNVRQSERDVYAVQQKLENTERQLYRWAKNPTKLRDQEEQVQRLVDTLNLRKEALAAAKSAEQVQLAPLMFLDVLPELAGAFTEHAAEGHLTIKVADRYSDALVLLSSAAVATLCAATVVCTPYTAVVRELVMTAEHAAVHSEPMMVSARNFHNSFAQDKFIMLEQYQIYLARAIHTGKPVLTLDQYFDEAALTQVGVTEHERDVQNTIAIAHNHRLGSPSTAAQDSHVSSPPQIHAKDPHINGVFHDCGPGQSCPPPSTPKNLTPCGPHCRGTDAPGGESAPPPCGAPGGPSCGGGVGTKDTQALGGIDLTVQGLVVDQSSGAIAVLTENGSEADAPIAARDLAFALWLVYSGQQAAFSLDPADPKDPSGKWLKAVYYPDNLRATAAGRDLFDADFLLKQYAFGVRIEGDQIIQRQTTTTLKSIPQLMEAATQASNHNNAAQWARMWIVVPRVDVRVTNGIARIVRVDMAVRARRQVPDPSSPTGLRDVDTNDDSIESQFAKQFSKLYTELGQTESPPLLRVRELAKAIAYAQWMKQQKIQVDMKHVLEILNQDRVQSIDKITALNVDWRTQEQQRVPVTDGIQVRTITKTIHIFGGVDLAVKPTITEDRAAGSLREAVLSKLALVRSNKHVVVEHEGHQYQAFVMPFRVATR